MGTATAGNPRTLDHQPGDGLRYLVLVGALPHDGFMGGGVAEDYVVVTVWVPFDPALPEGVGRTYVLSRRGPLTDHYVEEKFGQGIGPEIVANVADAIRQALGRPPVGGQEVSR